MLREVLKLRFGLAKSAKDLHELCPRSKTTKCMKFGKRNQRFRFMRRIFVEPGWVIKRNSKVVLFLKSLLRLNLVWVHLNRERFTGG